MLRDKYFSAMRTVLRRIEETQGRAIDAAASLIVESVVSGGTWNLYDTGHMLMTEAVGRAGGLMMVTPIRVEVKVEHESRPRAIPPNPNRLFLDQIRDLPEFILTRAELQAGDVLMIGSVSGVNVLPVGLAIKAREMGVKTIGITSVAASALMTSQHESGRRLYEVVDLVLDQCVPYGDALVEVSALDGQHICPASGIAAAYLMWALQATVIELLVERGLRPSVYLSNHLPGAGEFNAAMRLRYRSQGF
ncbi:MAG: sugar isomerase domain-containing protein [Firmicutes bacterium]|jgi:uncharacterized phosphosugar-binding protein|nr:sugar isomerase domain-containing protein [Bacillota bacterium]MDH7494770.1 sugar isomerase domain-containing protein [Bacillota bacterium]